MIQLKELDWVLNLINNPHVTTADLNKSGLNSENTSLLSADVYKNHEKITSNPMFRDENGNFDSNKFDEFYETALFTYNMLSNDTFNNKVLDEITQYGSDNIFVKPERRKKQYVSYDIKPNPDRVTEGLIRIGETELPTNSTEEIAQTLKVLVNPTEVYDENGNINWGKAIWHDAPNDSYFTDFFDTRVLATYESDGLHIDSLTGELVNHLKGEPILNQNGTYFYENLDGRDIYGKQVLNKLNTLTVDGSFWNEYDFFDSDDINQKSIGGSILKNAVLVGSMFIPYVGPWIAGLSVATLLSGLLATFGKMLVGSDSPTLSAIEGWSKSVNRQTAKSQYAKENTWCWENFIDLSGDVIGQLVEQRFLFEIAPSVIKGNKLLNWKGKIDETKVNNLIKQKLDYLIKLNLTKLSDFTKVRQNANLPLTARELNQFALYNASAGTTAKESVEKFIKEYQHIGSVISKGYMTMLTTADTYGEAKEQGASDMEATLLTLGYAAAEAALLNSDIGLWILPELKYGKIRTNNMLKALGNVPEKLRTTVGLTKEQKKQISKYWFNKGKELFETNLSGAKGVLGQTIAGGLAESVEEVSEELLADFSKSAFNVVNWLREDETRMTSWENVIDRYGMSLLGGFVGGGITAAGTTFRQVKENITPESALQEVVYMLRQGEYNNLIKSIDKLTFANPYLSSETTILSDGTEVQKSPKNHNTIDSDIKSVLKQTITYLNDILKSEGLKLSDNQFLDKLTLNDLKFASLLQSTVAAKYLLDFNTLSLQILEKQGEIRNLFKSKQDHEKLTDSEQESYNKLNQELLELRTKKDLYLNGDFSLDFISKSLFDLTPLVSQHFTTVFFKDWVKKKLNKNIEDLTEEELKKERENFKVWNETERKDDISMLTDMYLSISRQVKELIESYANGYNPTVKSIQEIIQLKQILNNITTENSEEDLLKNLGSDVFTVLFPLINSDFKNQLYELSKNDQESIAFNLLMNEISQHSYKYFKDFIENGVYNPEIRNMIDKTLNEIESYVNNFRIPRIELFGGIDKNTSLEEFVELAKYDSYFISGSLEDLQNLMLSFPELKTIGDLDKLKNQLLFRKNNIKLTKKSLKTAPYTNVTNFILNFIKNNSDSNIDFILLLDTINLILNQNPLNEIDLSNYTEDIDSVLKSLNILKAVIKGAYTDESISVDNLFGYNVTLNELAKKYNKEWEELPIISSDKAGIILLDIDLVESKLLKAKILHDLNTNKKLNIHDKISVNKALITYNKLKKFIVNIDDSWSKKELLLKALNDATILSTLDKKSILTDELKIKLELEIIVIDDAVYDLLNEEGKNLKDIFTKFDFYDNSNQIISDTTEELSSRNFLAYLASRASIKKSIFNNTFRQVIDPNQPIAPVSIQEEVVFSKVAEILNNSKSTEIYKAFNEACLEDFNNLQDKNSILNRIKLSESEKLQVLTKGLQSIDFLPRLFNIHLTEGDPGSGKSTAVTYYTKKIIDVINSDFFKNSWVAHGDSVRAEKQAKELGIETTIFFGKNELMSKIYSQYKNNRDVDREGNVIYEKNEWVYKNGQWLFNGKSDSMSNKPNIILIDEVSHYDLADLLLLQDFAEKNNIIILASGDFNQSSITAVSPSENLSITPVRNIFKTAPFIGMSMRTSNNLMDKSINSFKVWVNSDKEQGFNTYFYEIPGELRGIKNVLNLLELENTIDNLKINEKINLIYYDINSPFVKTLLLKYPDKFDPKFGNSAQGLEGLYYVVDFTGTQSLQRDKDFYTAITRASNGVITIGVETALGTTITSLQDTISIETKSPEIGYKNYAKKRKQILDSSNNTQELLDFLNKKSLKQPSINILSVPESSKKSTLIAIIDSEEVTLTNEIENSFKGTNESPTPKSFDSKLFNYMMYTFNSFELGVVYNESGNIQFLDSDMARYEKRIDSVIGLMKIFEKDWKNPEKNISFYKNKIHILRRIFFNVSGKDSLKKSLSGFFGKDIKHLEFGIISSPLIFKDKNGYYKQDWGYGLPISDEAKVFDRHKNEHTEYNLKNGGLEINRRSISAVIQLENGKWLTIPLFNLGNILTLGDDPSLNRVAEIIYEIKRDSTNKYEAIKAIAESTNNEIPQNIKDLAKLYLFTYSGYFKIDDETWTPASNLLNWGSQIINNADSNGNNTYNGQEQTVRSLVETGLYYISKQIHTSQNAFFDNNGNDYIIGNVGHPFIYVSTNGLFQRDLDMEDLYKKLILDPKEPKHVLRLYIRTPKVSIEKYLRNLHDILNGKESIKLGSHITSFHIWKALIKQDPNLDNEVYKSLGNDKTKIIDIINNASSDLVSYVKSLPEGENRSILYILNLALIQLTQSLNGTLNEDALKLTVLLIESAGISHIYYSPKFKENKPSNSLTSVIYSDLDNEGNSTYTIDGLDFTYFGKVDSNLFSTKDFDIASIVSKINGNKSTDTNRFLEMISSQQFTITTADNRVINITKLPNNNYALENGVILSETEKNLLNKDTFDKYINQLTNNSELFNKNNIYEIFLNEILTKLLNGISLINNILMDIAFNINKGNDINLLYFDKQLKKFIHKELSESFSLELVPIYEGIDLIIPISENRQLIIDGSEDPKLITISTDLKSGTIIEESKTIENIYGIPELIWNKILNQTYKEIKDNFLLKVSLKASLTRNKTPESEALLKYLDEENTNCIIISKIK